MRLGYLGLTSAQQAVVDRTIQNIVAKGGSCDDYATWFDTYTRLSNKDKSESTKQGAREVAAIFQQKYLECKAASGQAAAGGAPPVTTVPAPAPTTPASVVTTTFDKIANAILPSSQLNTTTAQPVQSNTLRNTIIIGGGLLLAAGVAYLIYKKRGAQP